MIRQTHTYAVLEVSKEAFEEIKKKLKEAGYEHAFIDDVIDMHGIALKVECEQQKTDGAEQTTKCRACGEEINYDPLRRLWYHRFTTPRHPAEPASISCD